MFFAEIAIVLLYKINDPIFCEDRNLGMGIQKWCLVRFLEMISRIHELNRLRQIRRWISRCDRHVVSLLSQQKVVCTN